MNPNEQFQQHKDHTNVVADAVRTFFDEGVSAGLELDVSLIQGLNEVLKRLQEGRFQVAYVGQMKAGKSTLTNATVFRRYVLPTAATPLTAKLTFIRHNEVGGATVQFYSHDEWEMFRRLCKNEQQGIVRQGVDLASKLAEGIREKIGVTSDTDEDDAWSYCKLVQDAEEILGSELQELLGTSREIEIEDLPDYVAVPDEIEEQGHYTLLTRQIEVRHPHHWPPDVEFVDTPGTNDPDVQREEATLSYLAKADAVVLVLFAGQPLSREDMRFLKEKLLPVGPGRLLIVLNKIDLVPDDERSQLDAYLKSWLRKSLDGAKNALPRECRKLIEEGVIVPISALRGLLGHARGAIPNGEWEFRTKCLEKGISSYEEALSSSGLDEFEAKLSQHLIGRKGIAALTGPLKKSQAILRHIQREGQKRIDRIDQELADHDKDVSILEAEQETLEKAIAEIEAALREFRNDVDEQIGIAVLKQCQDESKAILKRFENEIRTHYLPLVDTIPRVPIAELDKGISDLYLSVAWKVREMRDDFSNIFTMHVETVVRFIRERLRTQVDKWVKYDSLRPLLARLEEITYSEVSITLPHLPTVERDSWWFSTKLYPMLRQKLFDGALGVVDAGKPLIAKAAKDTKSDLLGQVNPILDEVSTYLQSQLSDKRRVIESKNADTNLAERRASLEAERKALQVYLGRTVALHSQAEDVANAIQRGAVETLPSS